MIFLKCKIRFIYVGFNCKRKKWSKKCLEICAIKGGGGVVGRLMAKTILYFHFDYWNTSLPSREWKQPNYTTKKASIQWIAPVNGKKSHLFMKIFISLDLVWALLPVNEKISIILRLCIATWALHLTYFHTFRRLENLTTFVYRQSFLFCLCIYSIGW